MSKVTLVFCKSFVDIPTFKDTFSQTLDVESPFDMFHLIGARVWQPKTSEDGLPPGDADAVIYDYNDTNDLLGRLLTYIDATYSDPEQRKAHKDIVKKIVWDRVAEISERARQTVNSHKETLEVKE